MPQERVLKRAQARAEDRADKAEVVKATAPDKSELIDDTDELLDEIDKVLEKNAAEFVAAYVQRGGQ